MVSIDIKKICLSGCSIREHYVRFFVFVWKGME